VAQCSRQCRLRSEIEGRTKAEIRETSDNFIELVGLQNFAYVYPHQLSGGMKQRVAIAEEAIFLADRVVVMSPGRGRIDNRYQIDLPWPCDIAGTEFNEWRRLLSAQLHSHHRRKAG